MSHNFKLATVVMVDGRDLGRVVSFGPNHVTVTTHRGTDIFVGRALKRVKRVTM